MWSSTVYSRAGDLDWWCRRATVDGALFWWVIWAIRSSGPDGQMLWPETSTFPLTCQPRNKSLQKRECVRIYIHPSASTEHCCQDPVWTPKWGPKSSVAEVSYKCHSIWHNLHTLSSVYSKLSVRHLYYLVQCECYVDSCYTVLSSE